MDIAALHEFCTECEHRALDVTQVTIQGKDTLRVSFTAPRRMYSEIAQMCEDREWTFATSADTFIARHLDRYQVFLDGRLL